MHYIKEKIMDNSNKHKEKIREAMQDDTVKTLRVNLYRYGVENNINAIKNTLESIRKRLRDIFNGETTTLEECYNRVFNEESKLIAKDIKNWKESIDEMRKKEGLAKIKGLPKKLDTSDTLFEYTSREDEE
jgi:hypothetical protein